MGGLTERSLAIAATVREIADELGASPLQVAIAWTLLNPAVVSPLIGARTLAQLEENLGALSISFTEEMLRKLESVSAPKATFPYSIYEQPMNRDLIFGGVKIAGEPR